MRRSLLSFATVIWAAVGHAQTLELKPVAVTEWKAVFGRVESRDTVPARARIGGIVVELAVSEGDPVKAGQKIAEVRDDKLAFQIAALDAQLRALKSQLATAQSELARGEALVGKGVITKQRIEQLKTQVDVVQNQISATEAQRDVIIQQGAEGDVLAPVDGRVLSVPVTKDAVIIGGEPVAVIGGGGVYLRLAIPERHAGALQEKTDIRISTLGGQAVGKLVKIYPRIENGRVIADVEVEGLDTRFVDARVLVEVPVGERQALLVPRAAVQSRSGLDFVSVQTGQGEVARTVMLGETVERDGETFVEILTGLEPGAKVIVK